MHAHIKIQKEYSLFELMLRMRMKRVNVLFFFFSLVYHILVAACGTLVEACGIDQGRWICRVTLSRRKTQFLRHKNICRNVSKHPWMLFLWQNENSEEKDRIARVTRQSLDSPSSIAFLPRQLMILGLETGPQGTTAGYLIFLMTDMHHWAQGSILQKSFKNSHA